MPPLSSPRGGPPQRSAQPVWALKVLRSTPLKRRMPGSVTSTEVNGYRQGLAPRNLVKFLATGQSSTDLSEPEERWPFGVRLPPIRHELTMTAASFWLKAGDLGRGWSVFSTLSPRFKVTQVWEVKGCHRDTRTRIDTRPGSTAKETLTPGQSRGCVGWRIQPTEGHGAPRCRTVASDAPLVKGTTWPSPEDGSSLNQSTAWVRPPEQVRKQGIERAHSRRERVE